MNKTIKFIFIAIIAAIFLTIGFLWQSIKTTIEDMSIEPEERNTLIIGSVSPDVEDDIEEYQPFTDYIVKQLANPEITTGKVEVAASAAEMAQWMRQGKIDIFLDSPFPTFAVDHLARSAPLVNRWKKGVEKYHAVIFVRKDSGITSLDGLKGKILAFDHKDSTSGYLLPKAELISRGYSLQEVQGPNDQVGPNEIGYYFLLSDNKLVKAVIEGTVAGAAQNEAEMRERIEENGEKISDYAILFTTQDVYRHVVTASRFLDSDLKNEIKNILLNMDKTEEGQEVLKKFKKTTKFTPFDPPESAYTGISELVGLVENEIIER